MTITLPEFQEPNLIVGVIGHQPMKFLVLLGEGPLQVLMVAHHRPYLLSCRG